MGDYLSVATDAGEQALDLTKRAQEAAVTAVANVTGTISEFVPDLAGSIPLVDNLPAPRDLASAYFDLAGKWFEAGRDYTLALIDAASPVTEKILPKPKTSKGTPKPSTKRAA